MHKVVHLVFSKHLRKRIEELTGIILDKKRFAYGNIKPDLSLTMFTCPHKLYQSFNVLKSHTRDLFTQQMNIADFSEKLGEVTHYLSDYFCFAHSDIYQGSGLAHYAYESSMLFRLRRFIREAKTARCSLYPDVSIQDLKSFVFNEYKSYVLSPHTQLGDMLRSFNVSLAFCIEAVLSWSEYAGALENAERCSEECEVLIAATV